MVLPPFSSIHRRVCIPMALYSRAECQISPGHEDTLPPTSIPPREPTPIPIPLPPIPASAFLRIIRLTYPCIHTYIHTYHYKTPTTIKHPPLKTPHRRRTLTFEPPSLPPSSLQATANTPPLKSLLPRAAILLFYYSTIPCL
jgi:hypothetical protein